jgi:uncharacterized protein YggE
MATVTVRGTGTAYGTPDEATVGLSVESVRPTAAEALADVAERTSALVTLCHEQGLEQRDVTTTGVSVGEHGEHDKEGRWQHRGYRARNRVSARIRDVAAVGALLTRAVDAAGAAVDGPHWRLLPEHPAYAEATRAAARDARARATALAEELGGRLGAIVSARDSRIEPPTPRPMRMEAAAMASEPMPIAAGELGVVATVDVEFTLEQG